MIITAEAVSWFVDLSSCVTRPQRERPGVDNPSADATSPMQRL